MSARDDFAIDPLDGRSRMLFSEDAEQAVLSAILMDERAIDGARQLLSPTSFYRDRHRRLFGAMLDLAEQGMRIDPLTLAERLVARGELDAAGGKAYIGELMYHVPTAANVQFHANIVRDFEVTRGLAETLDTALRVLRTDGAKPVRETARELFATLLPFTLDGDAAGYRHVRDLLWPVLEEIEARRVGQVRGLMTGYAAIDGETNGFRPGELIIVGGAEKLGKSAIALNIARRVLMQDTPVGVGYVSAEMTAASIIERLIAQMSRIDATRLQAGKIEDDDFPRMARVAGELGGLPLWIDDEAEPTLSDVVARATNLKAQHPELGLVVVDFMQLVQSPEKGQNEARELKRIAYGLKGLAKRLNVVVLVPCQVNTKEVEGKKNMRPELKDLQGSSGMRQAADFIALAYREGLYDELAPDADVLELNFAACRRTRRFLARLQWDASTMRING